MKTLGPRGVHVNSIASAANHSETCLNKQTIVISINKRFTQHAIYFLQRFFAIDV